MRRVLKIILRSVLVLLALVLIGTWFLVTQPVLKGGADFRYDAPDVAPDRLLTLVQTLTDDFFPRDITHPANLDSAATWIAGHLSDAGGRLSEQVYRVEGADYRNVIARFGPDTRERLVIGAHYDVCGERPGADDNASAVAGLIELARLIGQADWPLTIELVAYTLEEPPKFRTSDMGSHRHAEALAAEGVPLRAMICLEMIGYFDDAPDSQEYPVGIMKLFYPTRGDYIAVIGKLGQGGITRNVKQAMKCATELPVRSMNAPASIPGIDFSDHLNYWAAGYEAVMITDTAFYRNPNYHEITDTWDTLDYDRMAMVVQGVYAAVRHLAR
ncbi:M28 family peptidase [bacterium]|nr:M28 family peptidase [bacterium]